MTRRAGVMVIARDTFDVDLARRTSRAAFRVLDRLELEIVGSPEPLLEVDDVGRAAAAMREQPLDALVIVQGTFTDSTMPVAAADASDARLVLWAFPEKRTGGRLRLNSLCGINLAGYALSRQGRGYGYVYRAPGDKETESELRAALSGPVRPAEHDALVPDLSEMDDAMVARAEAVKERLIGTTIGVIGEHPPGFEPCACDAGVLDRLLGVSLERIELSKLFDAATAVPAKQAALARKHLGRHLAGLDDVEQEPLEKSVRLHLGLKQLVGDGGWSGVAARCWPECFTEYGGAACSALGLLAEGQTPGCCEADVYGTVTSLVLQWMTAGPAFAADLVDVDREANTGVFWHCGGAPLELADPTWEARATVHPNRKMPLLSEFPLKPGRVTIARLSQARGTHKLVVGGGEMLQAPPSFGGTSGVLAFDRPAAEVLDTVMNEGLEHHYGLAYGDVRDELRALAALLDLPVVELG